MYAFAMTAWEILTGKVQSTRCLLCAGPSPSNYFRAFVFQRPFETMTNQHQLEREVLNGTRPPLEDLPLNTPPSVRQLISDCWDKVVLSSSRVCRAMVFNY